MLAGLWTGPRACHFAFLDTQFVDRSVFASRTVLDRENLQQNYDRWI